MQLIWIAHHTGDSHAHCTPRPRAPSQASTTAEHQRPTCAPIVHGPCQPCGRVAAYICCMIVMMRAIQSACSSRPSFVAGEKTANSQVCVFLSVHILHSCEGMQCCYNGDLTRTLCVRILLYTQATHVDVPTCVHLSFTNTYLQPTLTLLVAYPFPVNTEYSAAASGPPPSSLHGAFSQPRIIS